MEEQTLSAEQVQRIIDKLGTGDTVTQRVRSVARMCQASEATLYDYKKNGAKKGPLNVLLFTMFTSIPVTTVMNIARQL